MPNLFQQQRQRSGHLRYWHDYNKYFKLRDRCEQQDNCCLLQVFQLRAAMGGTRVVPARWTETQKEAGAGHPGDGGGVQRKVERDQRTAHQTSRWGQSQEEAEGKNVVC